MRVRSKLLINTLTTIICLISAGGIGFYYIHHVANISVSLDELEAKPILKINDLESNTWERWLILIEHSGISDYESMQILATKMVKLDEQINQQIIEIEKIYLLHEDNEHIETLNIFKTNWQYFQQIASKILLFSQDFTKEDALNLIVKDGKDAYKKANNNLRSLIEQHSNDMNMLRNEASQARWKAKTMIEIILGFTIVISLLIATFISRQILKQVGGEPEKIAGITKQVAAGNLNIKFESGTATGIYADIQIMAQNLNTVIEDIIQISQGLENGDLNIVSKAEYRGDFIKIEKSLKNAAIKLAQTTIQNDTQNWIKTGQAMLNDKLRGEQEIAKLAKNIITFLANYVDSQVGIFYLANDEQYLQLVASYGYIENQNISTQLKIGEGLVGQAALERKTIIQINEQAEYISLAQSTLTKALLSHVILIPFLYENQLKGVIEIGSSGEFTETQRNFLEGIMPSVGIAINTAESRTKMQELLQK